jgi:PAS domain S-box-containing protein
MKPDETMPQGPPNELALYKMIVNASHDSITLIDRNYTYRIVTDAYLNARKLTKDKIVNHTVADIWGRDIFENVIKEKLDECFRGRTVSHRAAYEFRKNEKNYIETIYTPCFTSGAEVSYAAVISRNITELKRNQEKIAFLAYYDSLTNLPSRPLFLDLLSREITSAKRSGTSVAVFFFDLDEFKKINDTFGHSAGDQLLVSVAKRLRECLREGDIIGRFNEIMTVERKDSQDYLARLGGDEFTFIIPDIADKKFTTGIAERILNLFKAPFRIADRELFISTSIGIAFYPDDGRDVETLLKNADTAMYKAKEVGKNTFRYYAADMNQKAQARMQLESRLRRAVGAQAFQLHYQPQYRLDDGRLAGMEALIHWEDPELGAVAPHRLMQLAEETGLIVAIGEGVLHAACRQGKRWHDRGGDRLFLGVNLSVRQFFDLQLVSKIQSALEASRFDPRFLELEVTETAMMHDIDRALAIMDALKTMGVRLALDDFGAGYSSLMHLKVFPMDKLKIDRVFIRNADLAGRDGAIVAGIIDMCRKLQIDAVAVGVETEASLNFLKAQGCHLAQGSYLSPPLTVEKAWTVLPKLPEA